MKRIAISALAVVCLSGLAFGQDNGVTPQYNATINSGPWHMRRMTGNRTADKLWFIMDHTLNSAEMLTLNTMFNSMPQNEAHDVRKAILHAIKKCSDNDPQYSAWWPSPGEQGPHISDDQIFSYMRDGLGWQNHIYLGSWLTEMTLSQQMAVSKLVRDGGWANSLWASSGMDQGSGE